MTSSTGEETGWAALPGGARAALEQQWLGVGAGGLPCGSAVTDAAGLVVAGGRNRAYESATGEDPLEDTPVAHAEINALARVRSALDTATLSLWSTQHPCAMCAAAASFIGIGTVRYVHDDPSDLSDPAAVRATRGGVRYLPLGDPFWASITSVLFLTNGAVRRGRTDHNLRGRAASWPRIVELTLRCAGTDELGTRSRAGEPLSAVAQELRAEFEVAALDLA